MCKEFLNHLGRHCLKIGDARNQGFCHLHEESVQARQHRERARLRRLMHRFRAFRPIDPDLTQYEDGDPVDLAEFFRQHPEARKLLKEEHKK